MKLMKLTRLKRRKSPKKRTSLKVPMTMLQKIMLMPLRRKTMMAKLKWKSLL